MASGMIGDFKIEDVILVSVTATVAAAVSFSVFMACFYWFRREQRHLQTRILNTLQGAKQADEIFVTGKDPFAHGGELVAQFKVNQGKQIISVLETEGKRFIHVDGVLSAPERAKMVRYLKSEGFMS